VVGHLNKIGEGIELRFVLCKFSIDNLVERTLVCRVWLALYSDLIISNLKLPNKFGVYEKRINGQPVKSVLPAILIENLLFYSLYGLGKG